VKLRKKDYDRVRKWRAAGDNPEAVARRLRIEYAELVDLLDTDAHLAAAFFGGRATANLARQEAVEDALYDRAVGHKFIKKERKVTTDPDTGLDLVEQETTTEVTVEPDPSAMKFFLTNVAPDKWRQSSMIQHDHKIEVVHIHDDIPLEAGPPLLQLAGDIVDAEVIDD